MAGQAFPPLLRRAAMSLCVALALMSCGPSPTPSQLPPTSSPDATANPSVAASPTGLAGPAPVPYDQMPLAPLPAPLIGVVDDAAKAAADLAGAVLADPVNGLAALEVALLRSGFVILGDPGQANLAPASAAANGLAIPAWRVKLLAIQVQSYLYLGLDEVGSSIADAVPDLSGAPIAQDVLDALRSGAADPDPGLQFMSLFLAELGRHRAAPQDLLDPRVTPDTVRLDTLQFALLTYRLAGDMMSLLPPSPTPTTGSVRTSIQLAVFRSGSGVAAATSASPACSFTGSDGQIVRVGEAYIKTLFKNLVRYAMEHSGAAVTPTWIGRISNIYSAVSGISSLLSYLWLVASVKTELSIDSSPLVRTKEKGKSGETKTITAHLSIDPPGEKAASAANCMRLALASLGMSSINPPKKGPLAGANVNWVGVSGFPATPGDHVVWFRESKSHVWHQTTGADGTAAVIVEGMTQEANLPAHPVEVKKHATVQIEFALKSSDLVPDLVTAITMAAGNPFVKLPFEMLQRWHLYWSEPYTFEVTDWVNDCWTYEGSVTSLKPKGLKEATVMSYNLSMTLEGWICARAADMSGHAIKAGDYLGNGFLVGSIDLKTWDDHGKVTCHETLSIDSEFSMVALRRGDQLEIHFLAARDQPFGKCWPWGLPLASIIHVPYPPADGVRYQETNNVTWAPNDVPPCWSPANSPGGFNCGIPSIVAATSNWTMTLRRPSPGGAGAKP